MTLSFLFTRNVHTLLRVPSENKPDYRPKWVKSTHFSDRKGAKTISFVVAQGGMGREYLRGAAFLEGCFECVRPKGGLQWFCLYLIFMYINNVWCLQPCINKGDDNDNGFWYSDQGHSSSPHPLPQLRWAHQCLTCMLVPFLVVRLKKKLEIFVSCKCLVT